MSSRLIEKCFEIEELSEVYYTWLLLGKGTTIIVVDPYVINIADLKYAEPGKVVIVRARRPMWGVGDLDRFIMKLEV